VTRRSPAATRQDRRGAAKAAPFCGITGHSRGPQAHVWPATSEGDGAISALQPQRQSLPGQSTQRYERVEGTFHGNPPGDVGPGGSVQRILLSSPVANLNEAANLGPTMSDRQQTETGTPVSRRPVAGIGRVLLWSGGSLWIGRDARGVDLHAHHAIQIALSMDSHFLMASGDSGWREHRGAIVMPDRCHRFDGCGQRIAMIFVERETAQGRILMERYATADIADLAADTAEALVGPLRSGYLAAAPNDALIAIGQDSVAALAGRVPCAGSVRSAPQPRDRLGLGVPRCTGLAQGRGRGRAPVAQPLPAPVRGADRRVLSRLRAVGTGRDGGGCRDERTFVDGCRAGSGLCRLRASEPDLQAHVRIRSRHTDPRTGRRDAGSFCFDQARSDHVIAPPHNPPR
jgi:hypothetical protein